MYLFLLSFQKNIFSHQRARVSVVSVLSFFFSGMSGIHRVIIKQWHTALVPSIVPVSFFIWFEIAIYQRFLKTQKWLNSVLQNSSCNSSKLLWWSHFFRRASPKGRYEWQCAIRRYDPTDTLLLFKLPYRYF